MTVQIQTPLVDAIAVGGQVLFNFAFRCDDASWITVLVNAVQQGGAAYAVALNADQTNNPGGTVTFGVAPGAGKAVRIERVSPAQQSVHYTPYGPFPATTVEAALDRIVMLLQELGVTRQSLTPVPTPAAPGTQVLEEVPTGAVNSTDGTDGNGHFVLAHAPLAGTLRVWVDGVRQPPARYVLVGNAWDFNAGYHPAPAGAYVCADYYY